MGCINEWVCLFYQTGKPVVAIMTSRFSVPVVMDLQNRVTRMLIISIATCVIIHPRWLVLQFYERPTAKRLGILQGATILMRYLVPATMFGNSWSWKARDRRRSLRQYCVLEFSSRNNLSEVNVGPCVLENNAQLCQSRLRLDRLQVWVMPILRSRITATSRKMKARERESEHEIWCVFIRQ